MEAVVPTASRRPAAAPGKALSCGRNGDQSFHSSSTSGSIVCTGWRSPRSPTGVVRGRSPVRDEIKQPAGLVHGGVYAAIAESLATNGTAAAVFGARQHGDGAVQPDQLPAPDHRGAIHAEARARHRGRTTWVWEVELTDDEGRLCVLARVTVAVRPGIADREATPGGTAAISAEPVAPCRTGAPRPSQNWAKLRSAGSAALPVRSMCVHASPTTPSVPGRQARITAPPEAASAGVNGGATLPARAARPLGGFRRPVHQHDVADLERLQQLVVGQPGRRCGRSPAGRAGRWSAGRSRRRASDRPAAAPRAPWSRNWTPGPLSAPETPGESRPASRPPESSAMTPIEIASAAATISSRSINRGID